MCEVNHNPEGLILGKELTLLKHLLCWGKELTLQKHLLCWGKELTLHRDCL
jgi:hypothetical protein